MAVRERTVASGRRLVAQVSFAQVGFRSGQPPLQGTVAALEDSLVAGTTVLRYNRLWRMAQHQSEDRYIIGRVGFEREGQAVWDDKAKDFIEGRGAGTTSRFVVDRETLQVAFQLRPGLIAPGTFRYNFQALLNEASSWDWQVQLKGVEQPEWEEWQEQVTRVVRLHIKMERPNPVFPGDRVEELFEGAKLEAVNMIAKAQPGESIRLDDAFIEQAIELAKSHGSYKAEGEIVRDGQTEPATWDSEAEGQAEKREVPADPATGEPSPETLKQELGEPDTPEGTPQ